MREKLREIAMVNMGCSGRWDNRHNEKALNSQSLARPQSRSGPFSPLGKNGFQKIERNFHMPWLLCRVPVWIYPNCYIPERSANPEQTKIPYHHRWCVSALHRQHDGAFYRLLEQHMPDWEKRKHKLELVLIWKTFWICRGAVSRSLHRCTPLCRSIAKGKNVSFCSEWLYEVKY